MSDKTEQEFEDIWNKFRNDTGDPQTGTSYTSFDNAMAALRAAHAAGERKGRAMGLREASNSMWNDDTNFGEIVFEVVGKYCTQFDAAADQLDPPTDKQGEAG